MRTLKFSIIFFIIQSAFYLNAAIHIVTSSEDCHPDSLSYYPGTLRSIIHFAESGDTITFAPDIYQVNLNLINNDNQIIFRKDITIDGGNDKVIFDLPASSRYGNHNFFLIGINLDTIFVTINNIIFKNLNSV